MSPLESFTKWLKLKIYQLEVTFSVYIFTPLEKFVFCMGHPPPTTTTNPSPSNQRRHHAMSLIAPTSPPFSIPSPPLLDTLCSLSLANPSALAPTDSVVFLLFSLTFIATILYLPRHMSFILGRAWFYMHGDIADVAKDAAEQTLSLATATAAATAAATADVVADTAANVVREL